MYGELDLEHCPTCRRPYEPFIACADVWPPSQHDVTAVRCQLPEGHRSEEHWHPPLWPAQPPIEWLS